MAATNNTLRLWPGSSFGLEIQATMVAVAPSSILGAGFVRLNDPWLGDSTLAPVFGGVTGSSNAWASQFYAANSPTLLAKSQMVKRGVKQRRSHEPASGFSSGLVVRQWPEQGEDGQMLPKA